jgi:MFS family permease
MSIAQRSLFVTALLAFMCVLSGTLLIPAVRPFMAWASPGNESAAHAFMSVNMLGGALAVPFALRMAKRFRSPARFVAALALVDGLLLCALALGLPLGALLAVRLVQGACNVAALSVLLGAAPAGGQAQRGAHYGAYGAAMMLAVAAGAPLGTLCLSLGPSAPLLFGALLQLAVAGVAPLLPLEQVPNAARSWRSVALLPLAWVFVERFAIGAFVVTFSFHAQHCLGVSDANIGLLLTVFLVPFCVAVYPAGMLTDRYGSRSLASFGLLIYGTAFVALAGASRLQLSPLMAVLGLSSAAVFAAAMREAGASRDVAGRVAAMSALNAVGGLGMLFGTAFAGIASAVLRAQGGTAHTAHQLAFGSGGAAALGVAALTLAVATTAPNVTRSVRS